MDSETQRKDFLYDFLAWFEVNKKRVMIGGTAFLVVCGGIAAASWYKDQREVAASEAVTSAQFAAMADGQGADLPAKLAAVAAEYSGTDAAARATFLRAGELFAAGKYAEAQTAFEQYQNANPKSEWCASAAFGAAASLDAQNKNPEAIAKYEDCFRRYPTDPNVDQYRLNLGMLYENAGKHAEAVKEYDKIVKASSYSPAFSQAQQRQMALITKYPNLAPVVAPPTPASGTNAPKISLTPVTKPATPAPSAPVAPAPAAPKK